MNSEQFFKELERINIILTEEQLNQLELYYKELIDYNKHTNLTAITKKGDVYLKHFYDSLTLSISNDFNKPLKVLDIGSGAGFPGVVLKIAFPSIKLTLLDSNIKKIKFLNQLIKKLQIHAEIVHDRSEKYIKNNREKFDIVTARAVKDLPVLSELAIPFVKVGGYFLAMKGSNDEEIELSKDGITTLGAEIENVYNFYLPNNGGERKIIKIKKIKKTSPSYPRPYEKILKKPLKKKEK